MPINEELRNYVQSRLNELRTSIQANMLREGENASGRTSRSIQVESMEDVMSLVGGGDGCAPLQTLESGSKGWVPFSKLFQWSKDKGIDFESEKDRRRFTFLLRRKIAREGTERYRRHVDVYTTEVENAINEIVEKCGNIILEQIKSTL